MEGSTFSIMGDAVRGAMWRAAPSPFLHYGRCCEGCNVEGSTFSIMGDAVRGAMWRAAPSPLWEML